MTLLFVALTAVMTWPQVEYLGDARDAQHQDVYFNMWRLRWFAHALGDGAVAPLRRQHLPSRARGR